MHRRASLLFSSWIDDLCGIQARISHMRSRGNAYPGLETFFSSFFNLLLYFFMTDDGFGAKTNNMWKGGRRRRLNTAKKKGKKRRENVRDRLHKVLHEMRLCRTDLAFYIMLPRGNTICFFFFPFYVLSEVADAKLCTSSILHISFPFHWRIMWCGSTPGIRASKSP